MSYDRKAVWSDRKAKQPGKSCSRGVTLYDQANCMPKESGSQELFDNCRSVQAVLGILAPLV